MEHKGGHPSDQDLLRWLDGELDAKQATEIGPHVNNCGTCRTRKMDLDRASADVAHSYRDEFDGATPPIEGPRAMLRARIMAHPTPARWRPLLPAAGVAALLVIGAVAILTRSGDSPPSTLPTVPNVNLTPGDTSALTAADVCSAGPLSDDPEVPDSLKREVLHKYGIQDAAANAYEIDYLVTPRLGGSATLSNLWPQPAFNSVWNARVKDALEQRLHDMVCSRQLDLATAQRELKQNWIAAYQKYFHTREPLRKHLA